MPQGKLVHPLLMYVIITLRGSRIKVHLFRVFPLQVFVQDLLQVFHLCFEKVQGACLGTADRDPASCAVLGKAVIENISLCLKPDNSGEYKIYPCV